MEQKNRFLELDALRGIAALMVVFFHFTMNRDDFNPFFRLGTTGVDLFFIISGFVIFFSIHKITQAKEYIINRASRLYPTYWASVTFTFLFIGTTALLHKTIGTEHLFLKYIANLTMFQFYMDMSDLDGPYWTMIIEMLFYISILIFYQFKILNHIKTIGVITCILTLICAYHFYETTVVLFIFRWIPIFQFIPLFFAGILFYKLYTDKKGKIVNYIIILFCLICQISLFPISGRSMAYISWIQYNTMMIIYFILFVLFVNLKLKWIINRYTLFLGKISFALYLTHQSISLNYIIPYFCVDLGINFWIVTVFINLPILIGIAAFITYKIEIPFSKKMRERLSGKRKNTIQLTTL